VITTVPYKISANLKTKIMLTNEEVKAKCIKELEDLIQNIKDDKTSNNYSFNMEVLEINQNSDYLQRYVSYGIRRSEYLFNKEQSKY
jgi:hypothetical protein